MSATPILTVGDLKEGDRLPTLSYDVTATTIVMGAMASRDWRPMHHDYRFAVDRNGTKNIFLNTPNQAAWFERYLTDWTGPTGRLARMKFRMRDSIFPGDTMVFNGSIERVETDETGCAWVELTLVLTVGEKTMTTCEARVAVASRAGDNPWKRRGDAWRPEGAARA